VYVVDPRKTDMEQIKAPDFISVYDGHRRASSIGDWEFVNGENENNGVRIR